MRFSKKNKNTIGFPAGSKKVTTFIRKGFEGPEVCFSIEQQTFNLGSSEDLKHAKWTEKMLRIALRKLKFK